MRCLIVVLACLFSRGAGQNNLFDAIQSMYLQQGLPFRENVYLDNLPILEEYDFVVVGSGPAGSAIANRLSEEKNWNILLIEKGSEGNIYNDIPFINIYTLLGNFSKYYKVEEQPEVCTGLVDRKCDWPTGNGVGGATLINGLLMTRGDPLDFDRWAADGNPGWSYEDLLPYFLKSENMTIESYKDKPYHSINGMVSIDFPFRSSLGVKFIQAGEEMGYETIDINDPSSKDGFSPSQITMKNGRRHSAASAYLHPIKMRKNLHIVKNTLVTKVLINPETKKAEGVEFVKKNKKRRVLAKKEVILSAGAFGSPQLLMLSGIGPKDHLDEMSIDVIQDLPVGNNLQEHLGCPAVNFFINTNESFPLPTILRGLGENFRQWMNGGGPFTNNGPEALAYLRSSLAENIPDIELIFLPLHLASDGGLFTKTMRITDEVYDKTWRRSNFREGFMIAPMAMFPRSRGYVRLRSKDPNAPPVINANFYADPRDAQVVLDGIRAAIKVSKAKVFQDIGTRLNPTPVFGCHMFTFDSDEYWNCVIRHVPVQFHHQSGTCRMGPDRKIAVVDPTLKVHGIEGLRVADASIMPYITGRHTMAPSYLIGEKAADFIKEQWLDR